MYYSIITPTPSKRANWASLSQMGSNNSGQILFFCNIFLQSETPNNWSPTLNYTDLQPYHTRYDEVLQFQFSSICNSAKTLQL